MVRQQIGRIYAERPGFFLIAMAIMAAFLLGLIFLAYYAMTNQRDSSQMGVNCTDWTYQSPVEKHLSGPDVQQMCGRYFASRSQDDAQRDDAVWQQKIDAANAKWEARQQ
jgi:hypothetical protein